jgi:hypothetical protein
LIRHSVALSIIAALPFAGVMCVCLQRLLACLACLRFDLDFELVPEVAVEVELELDPEPAVALARDPAEELAPDPELELAPELEDALLPGPAVELASDDEDAVELATAAEARPALAHNANTGAHSALTRLIAVAAPSSRRRMIAYAPTNELLRAWANAHARRSPEPLGPMLRRGLWGVVQWQDIRFWS